MRNMKNKPKGKSGKTVKETGGRTKKSWDRRGVTVTK